MTWLARDVWSSTDASDGRPFTWSAANAAVETLCAGWEFKLDPSLGRVMAVAGALEDPFATSSLAERMPTLIRRFVNRFRRSRQVTSFRNPRINDDGAWGSQASWHYLRKQGTSVTLSSIRDSLQATGALEEHPDAGVVPPMRCGDSMRPIDCFASYTATADRSTQTETLVTRPDCWV